MSLAPDTKLGPYKIISAIGAGGMGEVYLARDIRLERDVAVKILPPDFCQDSDRRARFEREARAAGQLNHPNILAVFDVGSEGDTPYIVTELLEGDTLRGRLRSAATFPARKAVECAAQVARGLGAAHDKGVIHRDIKPENIFICQDGQVKILDFGLARLSARESEGSDDTMSDSQATAPGTVLGTAAYMSPEQARGKAADARSDIFSLGAVFYEMLSGRRPFAGSTPADLVSAILKEDPPPLPAATNVKPVLERVVRRCLEKNPSERFQSARDLAFQLESMVSNVDSGSGRPADGHRASVALSGRRLFYIGSLLAAVLIISALGMAWRFGRRLSRSVPTTPVQMERLTDFVGLEESPALSPDGRSIAFVSDSTGSRQIWVRLLAGGPALQLTHDAGDHLSPRWSADSASLFYYTPSAEKTSGVIVFEIPALGGPARRIVESLSEVDPSHDGKSLAFFRLNSDQIELVRTDRDGSNAKVLSRFPKQSGCHQPRWSPDDSRVAFMLTPGRWSDDIFYVSASGGSTQQVTHEALYLSGFSWLPDGTGFVYSSPRRSTLLYLPTEQLWRISLDGRSLKQLTFGDEWDDSPDVDSRGRIAISRQRINFDIWKFPVVSDPSESVRDAVRVTHQTGQVQTPSLDKDNREMVYLSDTGGHGNLWIMDLQTQRARQLTFEKDPKVILGVPLWSPDGSSIAYVRISGDRGTPGIEYWRIHPDGSENQKFVANGAWFAWSWDSHWAYYSVLPDLLHPSDVKLLKQSLRDGSVRVVRDDLPDAPAPAPDGSTLYYVKTLEPVNGLWDYEIRVANPESSPSRLLASISGSRVPMWQGLHPVISGDGKWLALPLNDQFGTNLWLLSTADGKMRPLTNFGDRRTFIARHVAWSTQDKFIYAAVGDGDADIFLLDGLTD